jgi:segregation and condensation protein A
MTFQIQLQQFQGPFDLLLFFIERDELDIQDIPIAKITDDFLAYLHQLQEMNLEVASEFILVAATLMKIKAKMLIPRKEIDAHGNEIDPRTELVSRLIEYKRYKSVLEEIRSLEEERQHRNKRGNQSADIKIIRDKFSYLEELHSLDLYKLLKTFQKVLRQHDERNQQATHVVYTYPFTMDQIKERIITRIGIDEKLSFETFLGECQSKLEAIFYFLSILELLQQRMISLMQGEGYNNFLLTTYLEPVYKNEESE